MKNWRTTVSAWVAGIGAYVYFVDPSVIQAIPEPYRTFVWKGLGYLAFIGAIGTGTFASDKAATKSTENSNSLVVPTTLQSNQPETKTP